MARTSAAICFAACWALLALTAQVAQAQRPPGCSATTLAKIAFGVGTSAPQVEGAATAGGRTPSVWDTYAKSSGKIQDGTTPAVAADFYNRYKEDIALMKSMGVRNLRMSISWSRLIPSGRKGGRVSQDAVKFYNAVFTELAAAGISPAVTLYHWDLPQVLQDAYQGFLSSNIQDDFVYYADTAFRLFGGRVKKWVTFNEPWIVCGLQYGNGDFAPGISYGASGQYRCGHNLLLAHAKAYRLYRSKYSGQGGKVGMALWTEWSEPYSQAAEDKRAAQNKMDVDFGWFADPINFGDYPALLKKLAGSNLPTFTEAEKKLLRRSYDYLGMTLYTAKYARSNGNPDGWWVITTDPSGKTVGEQAQSYWLYNVPWSLQRMASYMAKRYGNPEIWLLESGWSEKGEAGRTGAAALRDSGRVRYFSGYIGEACKLVDSGVRLTHYFTWSFTDNWEWKEGFSTKFGIVYINFRNPKLPRVIKDSGRWLSQNVFKRSTRR